MHREGIVPVTPRGAVDRRVRSRIIKTSNEFKFAKTRCVDDFVVMWGLRLPRDSIDFHNYLIIEYLQMTAFPA